MIEIGPNLAQLLLVVVVMLPFIALFIGMAWMMAHDE